MVAAVVWTHLYSNYPFIYCNKRGATAGMTTIDIKFRTQPHDGTPGKSWEDFEERLINVAAGFNDERGYSLADCFNRIDEGSAGGPAIVIGNADGRKAMAHYRRRQNDSYSLLAVHELDADHRTHMQQNHFQNGPDAWDYLTGLMREPVTLMQLREHDKRWNALDIFSDVGVSANTIVLMVSELLPRRLLLQGDVDGAWLLLRGTPSNSTGAQWGARCALCDPHRSHDACTHTAQMSVCTPVCHICLHLPL